VRIDIITLFPEIIGGALPQSILGRAQEKGLVKIVLHQLRDYAADKHRTVDDKPYGGGPGMLLKCEPVFAAIEAVQAMDEPGRVILFSPGGAQFNQSGARRFAAEKRLILLCGHYEGVDERVRENLVDEEVSIGDYVLTNGAVAALVVVDAVVRLLPGALGNEESALQESFSTEGIEGPQYTRPEEFRGWRVPEVLLSGNHARIAAWRHEQGRKKTGKMRPDLLTQGRKEKYETD
jgi:tRNA (guanine37-N1)-methyltransferase